MSRLDAHTAELQTCTYCPKLCRWACPVAEASARETVTPWGLMTRAELVRRGDVALDRQTAEIWTWCTGCGRCREVCLHHIDVPAVMASARAEAVAHGFLPEAPDAWASDRRPSYEALPEGGEKVLLPGAATDAEIAAAVLLLEAAGHHVSRRAGRALESAKLVVCLDEHDAVALRKKPPHPGCDARHLTEVVGLAQERLVPAFDGDVLYLDACKLARELGVIKQPRELLSRVISGVVLEATLHGALCGCCGAGAGFAAVSPRVASKMAREAVADVSAVPVVTASPTCAAHLSASLSRPVHRWAELVAAGLR